VGDFGLGLTKPVPDGGRSIGAGLDAAAFVALTFFGCAEEVAAELEDLVGSLAIGGFAVKGDLGALVAVLAVEIGAAGFDVGFVVLVLGALTVVVVEGLPLRASLIPPSRIVPPNRVAEESVGLLGSIFVWGSSSSVTLSGFALGSK
jgi:hypothetical protein